MKIDTGLHYPIDVSALPSTWGIGYVGEYCQDIQSGFACGRHSDNNIGVPHLRPMNVSRNGLLDFDVIKFVSSDYDARRLSEGDVLFNNTNSPELIGKTAYVNNKGNELAFSNHMTRLRFNRSVLPKFGSFQLHFLWMARYFLHRCVKHVNQASISAGELEKFIPFIAPPLPEQHRIVAKIEELFSELDKGVENLKTAREQLKVYRQALLKHAFEGKLTAQWRKENRDKLETADALLKRIQTERAQRYQQELEKWVAAGRQGSKPKVPKMLPPLTAEELVELPELPKGWGWVRFGDTFSDGPKNGVYKPANLYGDGCQIVRIDDFYDGQLARKDGFKRVALTADEIESYQVNEGDLLINRVNSIEYLGKCCEVKNMSEPIVFESNIMKISLVKSVAVNVYVTSYLSSYLGKIKLCSNAKHAVNQASINQSDVSNTPIPICSLAEQLQISNETELRLSEVDQLAQIITKSLIEAEALRQSILKKAFSGQLVPQDPKDEPASALLARIKAERVAAVVKPRKASTGNKLLPVENRLRP